MDAAFFDLDGCLVDSRLAISTAINHALEVLGLHPLPPTDLHRFIGPPLLETFTTLLGRQGADPARALQAIDAYREQYADGSLRLTTVVPGVSEVLAAVAAQVPVMIVTSKPAVSARRIVDALGLDTHVGAVFGPDLDALTEPKSVTLEAALAAAGHAGPADRGRTVMIGDRLHDVHAGRTCGTRTVGVTWGIGDRVELEDAGADHVVDQPADLLDLLAA